jgi:hypothetical protein
MLTAPTGRLAGPFLILSCRRQDSPRSPEEQSRIASDHGRALDVHNGWKGDTQLAPALRRKGASTDGKRTRLSSAFGTG